MSLREFFFSSFFEWKWVKKGKKVKKTEFIHSQKMSMFWKACCLLSFFKYSIKKTHLLKQQKFKKPKEHRMQHKQLLCLSFFWKDRKKNIFGMDKNSRKMIFTNTNHICNGTWLCDSSCGCHWSWWSSCSCCGPRNQLFFVRKMIWPKIKSTILPCLVGLTPLFKSEDLAAAKTSWHLFLIWGSS